MTPNNTPENKARVIPLEAFKEQVAGVALPQFLERFPQPFIVLETKEGDFGDAGFQTLSTKPDPKDEAKDDSMEESREEDLGHGGEAAGDTVDADAGMKTDLDLPSPLKTANPVQQKHAELAKKLGDAKTGMYVCPLVKRDVNKFASMITLGRSANNDVRINLPSVSKFHAYFTHVQSNNTWYVADANSSNGTFVNGERLKGDKGRTKLANGAAIRFGSDVVARFFDSASFYEFLHNSSGSERNVPRG
jgi:hypothetical protein